MCFVHKGWDMDEVNTGTVVGVQVEKVVLVHATSVY